MSWSRILPTGDASNPNKEGVLYYRQFLKEIRDNGMQPFVSSRSGAALPQMHSEVSMKSHLAFSQVTLYHFDHPQVLQREFFGWENRTMVDKFNEFADFAFENFGDLVKCGVGDGWLCGTLF